MLQTALVRVTDVRHVRDHVLWLRFSDGASGEVDLGADLRGSMLAPLRAEEIFASARLEAGTVGWSNGVDWAPESLYERLREAKGLPPQSADDEVRRRREHRARMPEISRFFGIIIRMFAAEHEPPHFHAMYGDYEVSVTIADGIVTGRFPRTALRLVLEWGELHREQLAANWERMRQGAPADPVPPLE